jgi:hypothetical protein
MVFCYAESIVYSSVPESGRIMVGDFRMVCFRVEVKIGSGMRERTGV